MTARTRPRKWREVERRPVPGNSPNDRILRGPDCNRPKRVCADPFPATPWPSFPKTQKIPGMRFLRHGGIYLVRWGGQNQRPNHLDLGLGCRLPLVGPLAPVKDATEGARLTHRPQMSSGRLFLDRVARQHCPSPLHRRDQTTTHPIPARAKQDISTLQGIGHFYFALTQAQASAFGGCALRCPIRDCLGRRGF
jgi:hypothetical protein